MPNITSWYKSNNSFYAVNGDALASALPAGVYTLEKGMGFRLDHQGDSFPMPATVYGMERGFIDHVKRAWQHSARNLGLMATGLKGSGKSLTMKLLCNELQLPVILIGKNHGPEMVTYLQELRQDIIVFCDEYEKVFVGDKEEFDDPANDATMLTLMDGAMASDHRMLFLLTTNKLDVNENMLQRPGRVRYLKHFGNLTRPVIEEIVDDMLLWPQLREATVSFLSQLAIITVDIVTSILHEVNVHQQEPEAFAAFFNVAKEEVTYNVIATKADGSEVILSYSQEIYVNHRKDVPENLSEYDELRTKRTVFGDIQEVLEDGCFRVSLSNSTIKKYKELAGLEETTFRLEPVMSLNAAYSPAF